MANQLTLPNGTPYNIVYENGRAYFAPGVFGNVGSVIPLEFRIVPSNLIPGSWVSYNGKKYAFIPESSISSYVQSNSFKQAAASYTGYVTTGVSATPAVLNAVKNARVKALDTISSLDSTQRASTWASTPNKTSLKGVQSTNATVGTSGKKIPNKTPKQTVIPSMGGRFESVTPSTIPGTEFWSNIIKEKNFFGVGAVNSDGSYDVQYRQNKTYILGDNDGSGKAMYQPDVTQFLLGSSFNNPEEIKKYQSALKKAGILNSKYVVSGIADNAYRQAMMFAADQITQLNWQTFNTSPNSKAYNIIDGLGYMAKNKKAFGLGGTGTSGPRTNVTESTLSFTKDEARSLLESYYAEAVGRRPNEKEVTAFNNLIAKKAKANPNVTTTTTTGSGAKTKTTVKTEKGFTGDQAGNIARKQAEADPKSHAFLINTKYFDALLAAVRNPLA